MTQQLLQLENLFINFDKTPILWDISLHIPKGKGKLVGIIGPNGAGKTTLIKSIMDLLKPSSGIIKIFNLPFHKVRKKIAYVPQRSSVDWTFPITLQQMVVMGGYGKLGLFHRPRKKDYIKALKCLSKVDLQSLADYQIGELSEGQKQRAFIARALFQEADIYFMDEPFAGIDHTSTILLADLFTQLKNKGKTLFIVHHDLNTVQDYFDWLIMLNMRLIACGKTQDIFTPNNIRMTYGKSYTLLNKVLTLSKQKRKGAS